MEVTFFSFHMNCCSFIEISISKNEVNLLENIMNHLVKSEKTLNSKFARCRFHLAEEFHIFEHVNIIHFFSPYLVTPPTVFCKIISFTKKDRTNCFKMAGMSLDPEKTAEWFSYQELSIFPIKY